MEPAEVVPVAVGRKYSNKHISVKELVPIVIAIHICGHQFVGKTVLSNCDNSA